MQGKNEASMGFVRLKRTALQPVSAMPDIIPVKTKVNNLPALIIRRFIVKISIVPGMAHVSVLNLRPFAPVKMVTIPSPQI